MKDEETIIDLKFGLSQLSGKQDLLIKLLSKFRAQYVDLADRLDTLITDDDEITTANLMHTVKGVSGNLGLKALNIAAKKIELTLATGSDNRTALVQFKTVLNKTLSAIAALDQQTSPNEPLQKDSLSELAEALHKNEYISPDDLDNYLSQSKLTESTKTRVTQAIDELDYAEALMLLESE